MKYLLIFLINLSWIWAADKPNVIIILSDDAGYADFGFQGNDNFKTPFIDSIAKDGVVFTNGYVSASVCSPSRAGLLTGRYQSRFGHENNLPPGHKLGLPTSEVTFADYMKKAGYYTGVIGKWHLGYQPQYHPNKRGFDWFYGCLQGSRSYWEIDNPSNNRVIQFNGASTKETEEYMTDRLGDNAVSFITKNKDKPFFLYLSFTAVHGPYQSKKADVDVFNNSELSKSRKNLAGMTKSLDDNVGKVLKTLSKHNLSSNTIVIFINDNGGTGPAKNIPLSGKKGTFYEGGIRIPFCMKWPGTIKPSTVIEQPVITLDLLPTVLSATKLNGSSSNIDGVNVLPVIKGEKDISDRKLFWRKHTGAETAWAAMRYGKWKLHKRLNKFELFDLEKDLAESLDVKQDNPEVFKQMKEDLKEWEKEMMPPLFGKGAS